MALNNYETFITQPATLVKLPNNDFAQNQTDVDCINQTKTTIAPESSNNTTTMDVDNTDNEILNQAQSSRLPFTPRTSNNMNVHQTPNQMIDHNENTVQSSIQVMSSVSHINGEVTLTPINNTFTPQSANPHGSMVAITPMTSGTSQAKNSIKIINCVSTVKLGCELNLFEIYSRTRYSEYNPSRFQGVVMKILEPRATALVFKSGKIVCTGTRTEHDSYTAARKIARIIQKLGFPARFLDFKVQNFVATADVRFPIRLEALQQSHGQFTSYEPELFAGLVYRMVRPRVVLLIFVNGKIVITGGKSRNEISESLDVIYPILRSFRIS